MVEYKSIPPYACYQLKNSLAVFASYDGEVGGPGTSSTISGGLRLAF
jgi:hypothetical protein